MSKPEDSVKKYLVLLDARYIKIGRLNDDIMRLTKAVAARETRIAILEDALIIASKIRSKDDANRIATLEAALREVLSCAEHCSSEGGVGCYHCARVVRVALR